MASNELEWSRPERIYIVYTVLGGSVSGERAPPSTRQRGKMIWSSGSGVIQLLQRVTNHRGLYSGEGSSDRAMSGLVDARMPKGRVRELVIHQK
jgi:hypothetical protein